MRGEPAGSAVLFEVICISLILFMVFVRITLFCRMFDIRLDRSVMTEYIEHYGRAVGGNGRVSL